MKEIPSLISKSTKKTMYDSLKIQLIQLNTFIATMIIAHFPNGISCDSLNFVSDWKVNRQTGIMILNL